jgi:hypothetical protein
MKLCGQSDNFTEDERRRFWATVFGIIGPEWMIIVALADAADYSKCLESMYLQDRQLAAAEEANRQARVQAAAEGLRQAGAALQSISPPPQPVVHCNSLPTGIGTSTTCF